MWSTEEGVAVAGAGGGFNDYHVMVASRPLGSSLSKDPLPSQLHLL